MPKQTQSKRVDRDVDAFMAALDHPLKAEIEALRAIICPLDPRIVESVKWNAPSYAIDDHFATLRLYPQRTVQVVLHTGAKVKPESRAMTIDDPDGLIVWATSDRGAVAFADIADIERKRDAFVSIVRQWIAQLAPEPR